MKHLSDILHSFPKVQCFEFVTQQPNMAKIKFPMLLQWERLHDIVH